MIGQQNQRRRISNQSRGLENFNQTNPLETIDDTYYRINITKGESLQATKDYSSDSKQLQFLKEGMQAYRQEDDSKINMFDIDRQEIENMSVVSQIGGQKLKDERRLNKLKIQIPDIEDTNEDYQKIMDIKKCISNKILPLSPDSSNISLSNKKSPLLTLEYQMISPMSPMGSSVRMNQEDRLFIPQGISSQRQKSSQSQTGGMKNIFSLNQNNSQLQTNQKKIRQQKSLQTGQSISSQFIIQNQTTENINLNGNYNSNSNSQSMLTSVNNNLLKSMNLRQKKHNNTSVHPLNKSQSNETTPKGSLARQNSLAKTQQYFVTNYNFTNVMNESMHSFNNFNIINSSHNAANKHNNIVNNSIISGINTPMTNTNIQQNSLGGKFSQVFRNGFGYLQRDQWKNALKIIYVQRFKKKMMSLIAYRFKHSLTPEQLQLLDDKSHFIQEKSRFYNLQSTFSNCCSMKLFSSPLSSVWSSLSQFLQNLEAIQPNSPSLLLWKLFFIVVSFFSVYYYSLKAAFEIELASYFENSSLLSILLLIFNLIFAFDLFIDLNTGFYQEGIVQHSRVKIIQRSIRFDFWIHILKIILLFYQISSDLSSPQLYLICFLHLYSMSKDFTPLDQHQQLQQKWPVLRLVVLLFIVILTVAHLSGCFFYSISSLPNNSYSISTFRNSDSNGCSNWVSCQALDDQDWRIKYVFSLYFSYITMVTVGYGDIFPVSVYEKIYVIIMTCISCGIFGYAINKIGSVINENAQKQLTQKQEQYEIINYMHNRQISMSTQIKILKFIEHVQEKEKENPINGQLILKKVSKNLKQQVYQEYFGNILKQSKLFKLTFSQGFLDELITHMNEVLFSPDEIILNSNESTDNILYFLVDGSIGVYSNFSPNELKLMETITKKEFIGLTNFFSEQKEENIILKTIETSLIVGILHKDFMKCINNYPIDLEKYHTIKQNIICSSKRLEQCSLCNEFSHTVQKCHLLHLSLNTELIKLKYLFSSSQLNRDATKTRTKKIKINTFVINKNVRKKVRMIRSNLILESRGHQLLERSIDSQELQLETDHHFLKRVAQIKFSQNQLCTLSDLNVSRDSNNSNLTYETNSDDEDKSSDDSQYNQTHMKTHSYNQIEEMEEEYGAEEIDEQNNNSKTSFNQKKQFNFQQEPPTYKQRMSYLLSPNDSSKHLKKQIQDSDIESNENIQSRQDLQRSANNIEQAHSVSSSTHLSEYQLQSKRSYNEKHQKEKRNKKIKQHHQQNLNHNKDLQNKQNSQQKITHLTLFKAQPLKSNSLPKNQPHINNKEQPLKSYSLPRYNQLDDKYDDNNIKKIKSNRFSLIESKNVKQYLNAEENEKENINSSIFRSGNESSFQSNQFINHGNSNSFNFQNEQPVPQLKISFAPPVLNNKPKQDIQAHSKKHQEKIDKIINQLVIKSNDLSSEDEMSIQSAEIICSTNNQFKLDQSNLKSQENKSQVFLNTDSGNNQSVRNQTDQPTTLPTNQDDFNFTEQLLINLNKSQSQTEERSENIPQRQKAITNALTIQINKEDTQGYKRQKTEKKSYNNIDDKRISIILTPDRNYLQTPEPYVVPSMSKGQKIQKSFTYQQSETSLQPSLKIDENILSPPNLKIANKTSQLTKIRTFDERTDKSKRKVIKKSTLEFDIESENTYKGEKLGYKKRQEQNINSQDYKQQVARTNSNVNQREKRNNYLIPQLNRRKSFRIEVDNENPQSNSNNLPIINIDHNTNTQQITTKKIRSINKLYDEGSPSNNNNQQKENNNSNQNDYLLKKMSLKGSNNYTTQNSYKNSASITSNSNANNQPHNNNTNFNNNNNNSNFNHSYNTNNSNINGMNKNNLLDDQYFPIKQHQRVSITINQPTKNSIILDDPQNNNQTLIKASSTNIQNQNFFTPYEYYKPSKLRDNLFVYDFDLGKEWDYFLPQNNKSQVIKEFKKHQRQIAIRQKVQKPKIQMIARQVMNKKRLTALLNTPNNQNQ